MFKFKNAKDWKTTLIGVISGIVMIAGIMWPDKVNPETQEVIKTATSEIIMGVAVLIPALTAIFGSKDGDKEVDK